MDIRDKLNIMVLEGETESFCDVIRDLQLELLSVGETKTYGTYGNTFKCVSIEPDGDGNHLHVIEANFYEQEAAISLGIYTVGQNNEVEGIYWHDAANGSAVPEEHPEWSIIRENMDIFLDDD